MQQQSLQRWHDNPVRVFRPIAKTPLIDIPGQQIVGEDEDWETKAKSECPSNINQQQISKPSCEQAGDLPLSHKLLQVKKELSEYLPFKQLLEDEIAQMKDEVRELQIAYLDECLKSEENKQKLSKY